jgi:peroxiredoxin
VEAALIVAVLVLCALVAGQGYMIFTLVRQHGERLLREDETRQRLAVLEQGLDYLAGELDQLAPVDGAGGGGGGGHDHPPAPQGIPVGTEAPTFHLPLLAGGQRRLEDYRGAPVLVASFNTGCGFCVRMAPALGALGADAPRVVLLAQGDEDALRAMAAEHGWQCDVALDRTGKVAQAYEAAGTPTGYLVDDQGRIATPLALGADALLALVAGPMPHANGNGHGNGIAGAAGLREKERLATERARGAGLKVRDINRSRLKRDGLATGTAAPSFELPDVDGVVHRLEEFRGRPVLLVFSDPQCGPCQALAPQLEAIHRRGGASPQVVMISRGDEDANRQKVVEHGLTFPTLLQRHWEVSREYALFATPVAYLLDAHGVVAADAAIGTDAILALAP